MQVGTGNPLTVSPTVVTNETHYYPSQTYGSGATVATLQAAGSNIRWYSGASGGTPLPTGTLLVNGTHYYATQTIDCTESATRFEVTVTIN